MSESSFSHTDGFELDQLIDQYLQDTLSKADKEAFEARMNADTDLAARVDIQRWMRQELGDQEKQAFVAQLADIASGFSDESESKTVVRPLFQRPATWVLAAAAVLLILLLVFGPSGKEATLPMAVERPDSIPEQVENLVEATPEDEPVEPESSPIPDISEPIQQEEMIAAVDPADMALHPYLDPLVNRSIRSGEPEFAGECVYEMDGSLLLTGTVEGLEAAPDSWGFFLYSNKEADYLEGNSLLIEPIELLPGEGAELSFSEFYSIDLEPGRYYFFLADLEEEEPIWTGTFVVEP